MARPARVRIRSRNPCVLWRCRLLGWNVRLLTGGLPGRVWRKNRVGDAERSVLAEPSRRLWAPAIRRL